MSVNFILKAGGGLSEEYTGEMLLDEYMRTVLCEIASDSLPSATARSEVHLWHIDAFARLLKQIINKNPMDMVDSRYKVRLPQFHDARVRRPAPAEKQIDPNFDSGDKQFKIHDVV